MDERDDVDRADVRVLASVGPQIDPRDRLAGAGEQRAPRASPDRRRGEDGPVVIGVLVAVEQRAPVAKAAPIASSAARSRPSETFGTESSGDTVETIGPHGASVPRWDDDRDAPAAAR